MFPESMRLNDIGPITKRGGCMRSYMTLRTPVGRITLEENGTALTRLSFGEHGQAGDEARRETALLKKAAAQLAEYFTGARETFDLPLKPEGTPFQQSVWRALLAIPYGETRSYKDIAAAIGNPRACRAVGLANGRNPLAVFIPCHRVVGSNGKLTGFAGGLEVKSRLLDLERRARA